MLRLGRIGIVACGLVMAAGCGTKPAADATGGGSTAAAANEVAAMRDAPPSEVVTISLPDLYAAQKRDETLKEFEGKTLEASGDVRFVGSFEPVRGGDDPSARRASLVFTAERPLELVDCPLVGVGPDFHGRVVPGQAVTVRGRYQNGETPGFVWTVVKYGPMPAPILKATEIAAGYAADRDAAIAAYNKRQVFVTGEVVRTENEFGPQIFLKGTDAVLVHANMSQEEPSVLDGVKPGDTVSVQGVYMGNVSDEKALLIATARRVYGTLPLEGVDYPETVPPGQP